jgi:methylamine dehydrogenase accessory protein MauD
MSALAVSHVLLWIAVVVLAGLLVVLLRQIGVLHARIAPAGALVAGAGPRPGELAPILEVEDWNGSPVRIGGADPDGRATLLCFISPTCPVCKALLPALRSLRTAEGDRLRLVLASDGPRAEHEAFVRRERLDRDTYVLSAPLGRAWQVASLPFAALIDERGSVRSQGLVNTREHLESLFEARERGVASVQEFLARRRAAGGEDA